MKKALDPELVGANRYRGNSPTCCNANSDCHPGKCGDPQKVGQAARPNVETTTQENQKSASDKKFEPEFDGDLEHQSWVYKHLFDDGSGF